MTRGFDKDTSPAEHSPSGEHSSSNAHSFSKDYWERHWEQNPEDAAAGRPARSAEPVPPNPYLIRETRGLTPGTALDAGCGAGAEALWLAARGWQVTGADISAAALAQAAESAAGQPLAGSLTWIEADLVTWEPEVKFDLVTTSYAHPSIPQLAFYTRLANWVAPGGTLLIVGHRHGSAGHGQGPVHGPEHGHDHGNRPPAEAEVTLADVVNALDPEVWRIKTAAEQDRTLAGPGELLDVVVRATRRVS